MKQPTHCVMAVTLKCNSRCISCDIWKLKKREGAEEVAPSFYNNLPSSLIDINITGGEPFLRKDLHEIIAVVKNRCKKARIIVSTNGLLTKTIREETKRILEIDRNVALRVSIEGIGKIHDEIRGIDAGFEKSMDTVNALKEIGVKDLGIGLTVSERNVSEIGKVYNLANRLGIEFSITVVTSSPIYFGGKDLLKPKNNDNLKRQFEELIRNELMCWKLKRWARAYYDYTLFEYIRTQKRPLPCDAGESFFYLDPYGNIYPCDVMNEVFGNLQNDPFEKIWASPKADSIRNVTKNCDGCWMVCTAKTPIKKNIHKGALWVIKNRIKTVIGTELL